MVLSITPFLGLLKRIIILGDPFSFCMGSQYFTFFFFFYDATVNFSYRVVIYCVYFRLLDCCCQTKATSEGWIWKWWWWWRSGKINLLTSNEVTKMSIWYMMSSFLDCYFCRSFSFPVRQAGGKRGYTLFYVITWSFQVISCINGIHLDSDKLLYQSLKDVVIHQVILIWILKHLRYFFWKICVDIICLHED